MSHLLAELERYEADIFRHGVQHGEARDKATSILSFLAARGLPIPDDIRSRILTCDNVATLRSVLLSNPLLELFPQFLWSKFLQCFQHVPLIDIQLSVLDFHMITVPSRHDLCPVYRGIA